MGEGGGGYSLWGFLVGKIVSHWWILSRAPCHEGVLLASYTAKKGARHDRKKGKGLVTRGPSCCLSFEVGGDSREGYGMIPTCTASGAGLPSVI